MALLGYGHPTLGKFVNRLEGGISLVNATQLVQNEKNKSIFYPLIHVLSFNYFPFTKMLSKYVNLAHTVEVSFQPNIVLNEDGPDHLLRVG